MISMTFVFLLFVFLGAVIGAMRGYAKEFLVLFAGLLALFIIQVFEENIKFYETFVTESATSQFWTRTAIIFLLAMFGYQTPRFKRLQGAARRERITDSLLGIVVGGLNSYLIIGSIWYYLEKAGYENFAALVPPIEGTPMGDAAILWVTRMPPEFLQAPWIFYAIAVVFTIVLAVYV